MYTYAYVSVVCMWVYVHIWVFKKCSKGMDERERLSRNDFINFSPHSILPISPGKTCIIGSHKNDIL